MPACSATPGRGHCHGARLDEFGSGTTVNSFTQRGGEARFGLLEVASGEVGLAEVLDERRPTERVHLRVDQRTVRRGCLCCESLIPASVSEQGVQPPRQPDVRHSVGELSAKQYFGRRCPPGEQRHQRIERRIIGMNGTELGFVVQHGTQ